MASNSKKKNKNGAEEKVAVAASTTTSAQTKATALAPSLIAWHAMPTSKGQQPLLTPIGVALADKDGFKLHLNFIPAMGGRIVLHVAPTATAETKQLLQDVPAWVAVHVMPLQQGQKPVLTTIGAALPGKKGETFVLQLNLIPTAGGMLLLRPAKVEKAPQPANKTA